jgi:glycine dehydrogenase subunit 1
MAMMGPQGLRHIGESCLSACQYLRRELKTVKGVEIAFEGPHFKEFVLKINGDIARYLEFMAARGILAGIPLQRFSMGLDNALLVAVTENRTLDELAAYVKATREFFGGQK